MNQKHSRPKLNRYTAGILVLLFAATIYSAVMVLRGRAETIPSIEPTLSADVKSQFSFSASDAPDWRQGPANKTSLALFYNPDDCFTSVEHNEGTVDAAAKLQESQKSLANSGYASTPGPVLTASLQTSTGSQQYQLHQYAVTGTASGGK